MARNFVAEAPNRLWVGDITYVPTQEGWLYLAALLDCYARRVVGWADHLRTELALNALEMAVRRRRPRPGELVHHTDRGCQYTSGAYQAALAAAGLTPSMSRKGECLDHAVVESFFSTLKAELIDSSRHLAAQKDGLLQDAGRDGLLVQASTLTLGLEALEPVCPLPSQVPAQGTLGYPGLGADLRLEFFGFGRIYVFRQQREQKLYPLGGDFFRLPVVSHAKYPPRWLIWHESTPKPLGQERRTGLHPKISIDHRADNSGQPAGGLPDQLPDPVERGPGKGGSDFRRRYRITGGDGGEAAKKVRSQCPKPSPPAPQGGFIGRDAKGWVTAHDGLNALPYVTLVRH
ncbi:MAG: IS3 family transposase [Bacillota bacterium]